MIEAASIYARLGVDRAPLTAGLRDASRDLKGFAQGASEAFAATFGVAAFAGYLRGLVEYGDRIQDLSERYKVNAEALQKIGNAAELNGSSLEGVAGALGKLEIAQSKAVTGSPLLLAHFRNLGISLDDLRTLSPDQLMLKLGHSSLNAADAVAVLGRNGMQLIPTLKGIADGSVKMGAALDSSSVKALDAASDFFKRTATELKVKSAKMLAGDIHDITSVGDTIGNAKSIFGTVASIGVAAANEVKNAWKNAWNPAHPVDSIKQAMQNLSAVGNLSNQPFQPTPKTPNDHPDINPWQREPRIPGVGLDDLAKNGPQDARGATEQGWHGWLGGQMTGGTIQAWWAAEQARQVKELEASARDKSLRFHDFAGAASDTERANDIRKNIVGLREADKTPASALKEALGTTEGLLDTISDKVSFNYGGGQ